MLSHETKHLRWSWGYFVGVDDFERMVNAWFLYYFPALGKQVANGVLSLRQAGVFYVMDSCEFSQAREIEFLHNHTTRNAR